MHSSPALDLQQVDLTRGPRRILNGLAFTAQVGAITAVLGPNGAGKTTAFRCCTGLMTPDAGTIRVLGEPPGSVANRARVGWMPQAPGSWSGITPRTLLAYLSRLYATPQPLGPLMDELGVADFASTPFRRLSGGQKQALNLAAALVGRPEVVVLDEPTAGMDPHARHHTWAVMDRLRTAGVTIVLATHDMTEAARADHIHIMDAGKVVVSGTTAELTADEPLEDVFLAHTRPGGRR